MYFSKRPAKADKRMKNAKKALIMSITLRPPEKAPPSFRRVFQDANNFSDTAGEIPYPTILSMYIILKREACSHNNQKNRSIQLRLLYNKKTTSNQVVFFCFYNKKTILSILIFFTKHIEAQTVNQANQKMRATNTPPTVPPPKKADSKNKIFFTDTLRFFF